MRIIKLGFKTLTKPTGPLYKLILNVHVDLYTNQLFDIFFFSIQLIIY